MTKSLLVLFLMATQLLAGGGGSLYVCISHDGSFCCIDSGPETCECCSNHEAVQHDSCCHARHEHPDVSGDDRCQHDGDQHDGGPCAESRMLASPAAPHDDVCGCTHIPLMMTSVRQSPLARISMPNGERFECPTALRSFSQCASSIDALLLCGRWNGRPVGYDYALTVIATTVIRC